MAKEAQGTEAPVKAKRARRLNDDGTPVVRPLYLVFTLNRDPAVSAKEAITIVGASRNGGKALELVDSNPDAIYKKIIVE